PAPPPPDVAQAIAQLTPEQRAQFDALGAPPVPAPDDRFSRATLTADIRRGYLETLSVADALRTLAVQGGVEAGKWLAAWRTAGELAERLAAMDPPPPPPPPNPDDDPANQAALKRLLQAAD